MVGGVAIGYWRHSWWGITNSRRTLTDFGKYMDVILSATKFIGDDSLLDIIIIH